MYHNLIRIAIVYSFFTELLINLCINGKNSVKNIKKIGIAIHNLFKREIPAEIVDTPYLVAYNRTIEKKDKFL